jgi:hypothetical protein
VKEPAARQVSQWRARAERERDRPLVASLLGEVPGSTVRFEIDAFAIEAGRRSSLQPAHFHPKCANRMSQPRGWRLAEPARRTRLITNVDEPVEEGSCRDHNGVTGQPRTIDKPQAPDPPFGNFNICYLTEYKA